MTQVKIIRVDGVDVINLSTAAVARDSKVAVVQDRVGVVYDSRVSWP